MSQKKIIFRDQEIVEFCIATKDSNEIHNPQFMQRVGKRVIVPGMYALSHTLNLEAGHLKTKINYIKVLFNSLLSSGDFATLCTLSNLEDPSEVRLSAINHKDTLTSANEYTRMKYRESGFEEKFPGILRRLPLDPGQIETFVRLVGTTDPDVGNFLFAVAYASQALHKSIDNPQTEIESEIDQVINGNNKISPFYQSLEIEIPTPFPTYIPGNSMDYFIHFAQEKARKLYTAHMRCESGGVILFHSRYKLVGIPDRIILRMAKENRHRTADTT